MHLSMQAAQRGLGGLRGGASLQARFDHLIWSNMRRARKQERKEKTLLIMMIYRFRIRRTLQLNTVQMIQVRKQMEGGEEKPKSLSLSEE